MFEQLVLRNRKPKFHKVHEKASCKTAVSQHTNRSVFGGIPRTQRHHVEVGFARRHWQKSGLQTERLNDVSSMLCVWGCQDAAL